MKKCSSKRRLFKSKEKKGRVLSVTHADGNRLAHQLERDDSSKGRERVMQNVLVFSYRCLKSFEEFLKTRFFPVENYRKTYVEVEFSYFDEDAMERIDLSATC